MRWLKNLIFPYSHDIDYVLYSSSWMSDITKLCFLYFPLLLCPSPFFYSKILFFLIPFWVQMDISMMLAILTLVIFIALCSGVYKTLFIRQDSNTAPLESLIYNLSVSDHAVHDRYFVTCLGNCDSAPFFFLFVLYTIRLLRELESYGPVF